MQLNQNIFRANDIRGIAYEDLTPEVVQSLGRALGSEAIDRNIQEFIVGRDARLSSPEIYDWLSSGIISTGCNVIDIGIVTSPMFYHSTYELNTSSGVVITGSHNPGNYNGFKIVFNNHSTSSEEILNLKRRILEKDFKEGKGISKKEDIKETYIKRILESIKLNKNLNISIDSGKGKECVVAKDVYIRKCSNLIDLY